MSVSNKRRKAEPVKSGIKDSDLGEDIRLGQSIYSESMQLFEEAFESAFEKNRDYFVHSFVSQIRAIQSNTGATSIQNRESDWIEIDSLSKLRSIVGGRFQNIKSKWTNAGFPLKEHRGDKMPTYEIDQSGWIDLTNWIMSQGYDARLPSGEGNCLFEIRASASTTRS